MANERVLAIQQQRELHMKQHPQQQYPQQQHPQQQHPQQQYPQQKQNINIFSPNYARLIGQQPRATTSAFIGLGGVR